MAKAVVPYDKDLPGIPERMAHEPPTSYVRKEPGTTDEFGIVEGRHPIRREEG